MLTVEEIDKIKATENSFEYRLKFFSPFVKEKLESQELFKLLKQEGDKNDSHRPN